MKIPLKIMLLAIALFCLLTPVPTQAYFITSSGDPALAGAWVEDFSGYAVQQVDFIMKPGYYTLAGPTTSHLRVTDEYAGVYNMTGRHVDNGTYDDPGFGEAWLSFPVPVTAFGFNWGASDYEWRLSAYDAADNLLESYILPVVASSNAGDFFGIAAANISRVTLENLSRTYDWVMIDNLTLKQIPLPGTVGLLGSGLLAMWGLRRKLTR